MVELTLIFSGTVSEALYTPVSKLVVNFTGSSATTNGAVLPLSVFVQAAKINMPKAKINFFIISILINPLGVK
jgi:hypothetical protein